MMLKALKKGLFFGILCCLCSFFAVMTLIRLGIMMVTKGPKKMFHKKKRNEEPACLRDPALGTHGYLHLEDVKIHHVSSGPEDKPLMLFLHGFPESWYSWRHQLKEFSKDYRVVAVDMRGYGGSSKPSGIFKYHMELLLKDVKQIITALGYKSCYLVAHDWGGAIAWTFSGCYPEMVDKVVIMNCPHPQVFEKYVRSHWSQLKKSWYMFFFLLPILPEFFLGADDLKFFETIFKGKFGVQTSATTEEDVEAYKYLFQNWNSRTAPINYYRAAMLNKPDKPTLQPVKKPVLLLWGCKDLAVERGLAEASRALCQDLTIKYHEEATHWVQMDQPDFVNQGMREFLTS